MIITDALRGEHGLFYSQFEVIIKTLQYTKSSYDIRMMAKFLYNALGAHAKIEENILFKYLNPFIEFSDLLIELIKEHEALDYLLSTASSLIDPLQSKYYLNEAINLAYHHFREEETRLFPAAEQALSNELLIDLGNDWAKARGIDVRESAENSSEELGPS